MTRRSYLRRHGHQHCQWQIVDAAMKVHTVLGPGLLEHAYQVCHRAQLLSQVRLSDHGVGLLINFNVARLEDGTVRMVNHL